MSNADVCYVGTLERLIEEATRSTEEGVRRFVEPASGTLIRATSRQHHLVFGRRGSGKSSLLRKAAADLTVDRRPIAFVDLETFKGHAYPDVLLSILIETFSAHVRRSVNVSLKETDCMRSARCDEHGKISRSRSQTTYFA